MSSPADYSSLSTDAKRVVQGMRGIEESIATMQRDYQLAVFDLERKWAAKFGPAYDRRLALLAGTAGPTAREIEIGEKDSKRRDPDYKKLSALKAAEGKPTALKKFWAQAFVNSAGIGCHILDDDLPLIEAITNVSVSYPQGKTPAFTIKLAFAPNKYIKNSTVSISYYFADNEVDFTGRLKPSHLVASKINWKQGQNLIEKAQKDTKGEDDDDDDESEDTDENESEATDEYDSEDDEEDGDDEEDEDEDEDEDELSFWAMLQPSEDLGVPASKIDNEDEEREMDLELAFEFGMAFKILVPKAVAYFLGEAEGESDSDDSDDGWDGYGIGSDL